MLNSGTVPMISYCFAKDTQIPIITVLQYLTVTEINSLIRTSRTLSKQLLGQNLFGPRLFGKNIITTNLLPCSSAISCIAHTLLFRHAESSPLTYFEFKTLQSALSILSKQGTEHKKHKKIIMTHFCHKIKYLDLRVSDTFDDRWTFSYTSPMSIEANTTYTCNKSVVTLIEKFPHVQNLYLNICCRSYYHGPRCPIEYNLYHRDHLFQGEELSSLKISVTDYYHAVRINQFNQRQELNYQQRQQRVPQQHEEEKKSQRLPLLPSSKRLASRCRIS